MSAIFTLEIRCSQCGARLVSHIYDRKEIPDYVGHIEMMLTEHICADHVENGLPKKR